MISKVVKFRNNTKKNNDNSNIESFNSQNIPQAFHQVVTQAVKFEIFQDLRSKSFIQKSGYLSKTKTKFTCLNYLTSIALVVLND